MEKMFNNYTAIISGGVGDIGLATAIAFASRGADIALGDIHPEAQVQEKLEELKCHHVQVMYTQVDVSDANAVSEWVNAVENTLTTPRIIIANAAIVNIARVHALTPAQWEREMSINLNGSFYLTQCATAHLLQKELPGRVVFVGSWAGVRVHQHIPAYSVSKAALSMLCKCMALELAPNNILVNEVSPGYVDAGLSGRAWKEDPERREKARSKVPIKELITSEEVAEQIVYLCNPENKHMTGSTLLMDGGLSLL